MKHYSISCADSTTTGSYKTNSIEVYGQFHFGTYNSANGRGTICIQNPELSSSLELHSGNFMPTKLTFEENDGRPFAVAYIRLPNYSIDKLFFDPYTNKYGPEPIIYR